MARIHSLLCLVILLGVSAVAAGQATQPATRPAFEMSPELREALGNLDKHISPDVRAGRKPAGEREKRLARMMTALLMSERPENADSGQKNVQNIEQADRLLSDQFARQRSDPANASPAIQTELDTLEKLSIESIHLLDVLSRPSGFATTRDSQIDLAKRLDGIPAMLDREDILTREVQYHQKRLELLQQLGSLEKPGDETNQEARLAATKALLDATDAAHKAQMTLDALNAATRPTTQPGN